MIRFAVTVASLALIAGAAIANPLSIPRNAKVLSSDGASLGRVDRVLFSGEEVTGIQLIFSGKMIVIPANTLAVEGREVKTSLSKKEVRSLR